MEPIGESGPGTLLLEHSYPKKNGPSPAQGPSLGFAAGCLFDPTSPGSYQNERRWGINDR